MLQSQARGSSGHGHVVSEQIEGSGNMDKHRLQNHDTGSRYGYSLANV